MLFSQSFLPEPEPSGQYKNHPIALPKSIGGDHLWPFLWPWPRGYPPPPTLRLDELHGFDLEQLSSDD